MKYLKFRNQLAELILKGKKHTSWRINDEKNIAVGDNISLQRFDGTEFAQAQVYAVRETTFGKLTAEDKDGHEQYASDEAMYQEFSDYYKMQVTPETPVKVIKLKLI